MGPYCRFCDQRCFVHIPADTPPELLDRYRERTDSPGSFVIATCSRGQAFERKQLGVCLNDIRAAIAKATAP